METFAAPAVAHVAADGTAGLTVASAALVAAEAAVPAAAVSAAALMTACGAACGGLTDVALVCRYMSADHFDL